MKILVTHPKMGSAIERLASTNIKYTPHHEFRMVEVHPKRPDPAQLDKFLSAYEWCDIWDAGYWKTAEKLRDIYGERLLAKPSILSHHNPYDLLLKDWSDYDRLVVMNKTQQKLLPNSIHIPHGVDMEFFKWNPDLYTQRKTVLMVAQRIEGSKGIEPVARICKELGYQFILVGQISDMDCFNSIAKHGITFMENISDEELLKVYYSSAIHVCNSKDNFESGTMPILESMATGVPVITRRIGHIPDIYNEKNMIVRDEEPDSVEELRILLKNLMEDREKRLAMREEAWHTVRTMDAERRARRYSSLYYDTKFKNNLVSVILPVFGHHEALPKMIESIDNQTYPAVEIVIISDGDEGFDQMEIQSKHSVKYIRVGEAEKYGLGLARDSGVLEAEGSILVFLDQRFIPSPGLIDEFVRNLTPKKWLFGNKNDKRNFVENVSCIYRQEFIDMGMSNQLIDGYGGMSQELRERSRKQGFKHLFIEKATAVAQYSSHNYNSKKQQIRKMKDVLWKLGMG